MESAHPTLSPSTHEIPLDILAKIFVHAAQASPSQGYSVALVNVWAYKTVIPHLYHTVTFDRTEDSIKEIIGFLFHDNSHELVRARLGPRPASFIRNIWLPERSIIASMLFEVAEELEHIALEHSTVAVLFMMAAGGRVKSSVKKDLHCLLVPDEFRKPLMRIGGVPPNTIRITHLRFAEPADPEVALAYAATFPDLTHVATPLFEESALSLCAEDFEGFFARPQLTMLLLILYDDVLDDEAREKVLSNYKTLHRDYQAENRGREPGIFLLRRAKCLGNIRGEWESEVGGEDIWELGREYTKQVLSE